MAPKFGTSGLRGLVVELTDDLIRKHVRAFLTSCPVGTGLFVGRDLRTSSPDIAGRVMDAAAQAGVKVTDCGAVVTPALALAAMNAGAAAVMVTGSHIPADRNGLKFYTPDGEITKEHETLIISKLDQSFDDSASTQSITPFDAEAGYVDRYIHAFGPNALAGKHIGVYAHSTVGRDVLATILRGVGATVTDLGRSKVFVPVDTEAVSQDTRTRLKDWAAATQFDAIVSMDGDGDRPLITDATGRVIVGDILGQITARFLDARNVVTPVSSNTGIESGGFKKVVRTRIGSPFVIEGMEQTGGAVVGYEANGGFLIGFDAQGPNGPLSKLMTRDSVLPILATLYVARDSSLESCVSAGPQRFTAADRLQGIPTTVSKALVEELTQNPDQFLSKIDGEFDGQDLTDGLRITLKDGRIVHMRPSGNAPELRLYVEADSVGNAEAALRDGLNALRALTA